MSELSKRCGCCGREYTRVTWDLLPLVGIQVVPGWMDLELRNCACGSTLALERGRPRVAPAAVKDGTHEGEQAA